MDHRLQLVLAVSAALVAATLAAPTAAPAASSSEEDDDVVYDQRQNGSENLRINLSDLTIVLAAGDSLVPMVSDAYTSMLVSAALRNKTQRSPECGDGGRCRSTFRSKLKLSSLLQPLLSRVQHHR